MFRLFVIAVIIFASSCTKHVVEQPRKYAIVWRCVPAIDANYSKVIVRVNRNDTSFYGIISNPIKQLPGHDLGTPKIDVLPCVSFAADTTFY